MRSLYWIPIFLLVTFGDALAQGTAADYARAKELEKISQGKVWGQQVEVRWSRDGRWLWARREAAPGRMEWVQVELATGTLSPMANPPTEPDDAFTPRRSRAVAGSQTHVIFRNEGGVDAVLWWMPAEGARRPFGTLKPGETRRQHTYVGHVWVAESEDGGVMGVIEGAEQEVTLTLQAPRRPLPKPPEAPRKETSRESKSPWRPFLREHNVWLRHKDSGQELQLSRDGKEGDRYREPLLLSPDGTRLACMQEIPEQRRLVSFVESSPRDQLQPRLHQHQYLKPGDRVAQPRVRLWDVEKQTLIPVDTALFSKPWNLEDLRWSQDSSHLTFLYNERGHALRRVVAVERDGSARTLVEDRSATFVDYSQKGWRRWIQDGLLWMSERDGWNHLYLHDARTGALRHRITQGAWNVRRVLHVDEERCELWLAVMGIRPAEDPYHIHIARVKMDGTGFQLLTDGDGTRNDLRTLKDLQISPDGRWWIDRWSRVDQPTVTELRDTATGRKVAQLSRGDASGLISAGWRLPERFVAPGRDGKTPIHGILILPTHFDPAKRYPVIEEIYAGPHGHFVPKAWSRLLRQRAIAELGFIVVQIDGMGTNWRGKAFHDIAWQNIQDAGLPDRIAWMRAAAATRPWMDLTRVGIYGGSAGGQNALSALLHHGDFYKVAVADCGCHDNRMDKIWWNEAWMGELGPHYAANSNVTHAAKLRGKLLLIVGEVDRNVDPASTMQVVNALIKADKDFDLLIMPSTDHGAAETPYASRRRMDFFVRHLHGVEPRHQP